jgi:AAA15 family ATPase/GTPase
MLTYYKYNGRGKEVWEFDPIRMGTINLLVGASGSGKTRFLNTLFNFSEFISKGKPFRPGQWELKVSINNIEYHINYEGDLDDLSKPYVKKELIKRKLKEGKEEEIIRRTKEEFYFLDKELPKLERDISSITLLKEEEIIKPLYRIFSHMMRRRFHDNDLNLAVAYESLSKDRLNYYKKNPDLEEIWGNDHPVQSRLFLFKELFNEKYKTIIEFFKNVFPTIQEAEIGVLKDSPIKDGGIIPVFLVKEKGVKDNIRLAELSSGMQKVLLIVTDILSLPPNSIYIIDEYENSLGINAIDFLPEILNSYASSSQYFITTHHPYLINNMPVQNWIVFHRKGSKVLMKSGRELEQSFGKSKQKSFIQLLNNPFYLEGVK